MTTLTAFRPKTGFLDFMLLALKIAMRSAHRKKIRITPEDLRLWKKDRVTWNYLEDGSIEFLLEESEK